MVDVGFVSSYARTLGLAELRNDPELGDLVVLRRGNRLSIMPVSNIPWNRIRHLAHNMRTN